jgi:hypothetical protein
MNSESIQVYCPIQGCMHSSLIGNLSFLTKTILLCHLNNANHKSTHHLTNHSICKEIVIYTCCSSACPSSPNGFFGSLQRLTIHNNASHPPPNPPIPAHNTPPTSPLDISFQIIHCFSSPHVLNHWGHRLTFIATVYDHKPPNFPTTWQHFVKGCNKFSFLNLQASILRAITTCYTNRDSVDMSASFWWLLLHLDMLIFAPSSQHQFNNSSIKASIHNRIEATFLGDIEYLFNSAMQV